MDDEILKLLATKSNKSNPLNKLTLVPWVGFSIDAVEHFFKHATFVDESLIDLETNATLSESATFLDESHINLEINATLSEVEKIIKRIDKYEASLDAQGENVMMILKKIDEEICIKVILYLN
uniref:Uncharacterized protein n=1 Tax=Panagrolaimus sp. JU765 TaxID=591449 RepID=A0AC34R4W7_9BILA